MKNPFKLDDVVYHATHGKGKIVGMNVPNHVKENGRDILVRFENSPIEGFCLRQYSAQELSFKEWPKPDHNRPIQDGWWVCTDSRNDEPYIREVRQRKVRYIGKEFNLEQYTFHRYLGKDWK